MNAELKIDDLFQGNDLAALSEVKPGYYSDSNMLLEEKYRDLPDSEMTFLRDRIQSGAPWRDVIFDFTERRKSEWLERIILSPSRSLFLDLIDFRKVRSVLDLGAGYGQLTLPLARMVRDVICVEPTAERMDIIYAIAQQEGLKNIHFVLSDFFNLKIKPGAVDLAIMCGVYEWLGKGRVEDVKTIQESALKKLHSVLSSDGKLVIAIENRIGLKYLLGERDDHTGVRNTSFLPYHEAEARHLAEQKTPLRPRTYDMSEYEESLNRTGFSNVKFYLAFPDYKLPQLLVPADDAAMIDEVVDYLGTPHEHDGHEGQRSANSEVLQRIYRSLGGLDLVKYFAPSYVIVATK